MIIISIKKREINPTRSWHALNPQIPPQETEPQCLTRLENEMIEQAMRLSMRDSLINHHRALNHHGREKHESTKGLSICTTNDDNQHRKLRWHTFDPSRKWNDCTSHAIVKKGKTGKTGTTLGYAERKAKDRKYYDLLKVSTNATEAEREVQCAIHIRE